MEFLDNFVLPQSGHHMMLLRYILVLTSLILLPYLSLLLGSTLISVMYNGKGRKLGNDNYIKFSKDLIDLTTMNKSVSLGLGLVPMLSAAFCYAQLLHETNFAIAENIFVSGIFFIIAVIAIYTYKYSFHLKDIFNNVEVKTETEDNVKSELSNYSTSANKLLVSSGKYGIIFLLISTYILLGAFQVVLDSSKWAETSFFSILFSNSTFIYFLYFIAVSLSLTAVGILYVFFRPNGNKENETDEYKSFVKDFALKTGLIFIIIQPILLALNLFLMPKTSLTSTVFGVTVLAVIALIVLANMFYFMLKESSVQYRSSASFLFLILFSLIIIKDQYAFSQTTDTQFRKLEVKYDEHVFAVKEKLGLNKPVEISGADIFNTKCIACHQFEVKLVGPAYNDVLPKYDGKQDELVNFILKPVKVDPNFTDMPNQGLKPAEAKAIAEYIVNTYNEKYK